MDAKAGDTIILRSRHVGVAERTGTVVEVKGTNGAPPYVVEWSDHTVTALFFPGSDATIEPARGRRSQ